MGVRLSKKGGTNMTAEEATSTDWNDTFTAFYTKAYGDNTATTAANTTSETDIATITIPQNAFGASFTAMINAGINFSVTAAAGVTSFLRLYVNGSVVRTITVGAYSNSGSIESGGANFCYLASGLDSTAGNIIIKVSAQNSAANPNYIATNLGLTVLAIENNT